MADSELRSLDDGVDGEATPSNFADEQIVDRCKTMLPGTVTLNLDAGSSICRLAAIATQFVLIATTIASPAKCLIMSN
jgi:hypothetical protein